MKRVLILGGGFGGLATAHGLKPKLAPDDEIILVDARAHFMVGFRKTWALVGESSLEAGQRALSGLTDKGIQVIHAPITVIDPSARAAEVATGRPETLPDGNASAPISEQRPQKHSQSATCGLGDEVSQRAVPGRDEMLSKFE